MTDSTGAVQQSYTYGPYGYTSTSGNTTSNSYQYIGRETDAAGLYYLRNRYYNPVTHSFLKEDPMGLVGGPNLFQYAGDNPTTFSDPNGKLFGEGCLIGMAGYELGQALGDLAGRKPDRGWNQARGLAGACALGFLTEGLGPLLEGLGAADGAFADALDGLGPDAANAEETAANCGLCFAAGTPVETRRGRVPIEKIKVGDEVLARNMATGKLEYKKVTALTRPHKDHLLALKFEGEHAAIRATPAHPFWIERAGHAPAWITAGKIRIGDEVLTEKGKWEKVTGDVPLKGLATVYNFTVQDDHDYFVGTSGILVHNAGPCGPLDWSRVRNDGFSTPEHVMQHAFDNPARSIQGVFADDPIATTEQAWDTAVQSGIEPTVGGNGNWNYVVPYPEAGLQGGAVGNAAGNPILNFVRIVTEAGTNSVVTAFPE